MKRLTLKYILLAAGIVIVLIGIGVYFWPNQPKRIYFPDSDIVYFIPQSNHTQWGFFNWETKSVEILETDNGWYFPALGSDQQRVLFLGGEDASTVNLGFYIGVPLSHRLGWIGNGSPARFCGNFGPIIGPVKWLAPSNDLAIAVIGGSSVELINPATCTISQTVFQFEADPSTLDIIPWPRDAALSADGILAVTMCAGAGCQPSSISVFNPEHPEVELVLDDALNPSWSPQGNQLAFLKVDGIYILNYREGQTLKISEYDGWTQWPPAPEWSSDGRKLLFHRLTSQVHDHWAASIYCYDLDTGQEELLIENGMYPYWTR